jgi:hypothetical protein
LRALCFSTWVNIITSDAVAPRLEWDDLWQKAFKEPSPFESMAQYLIRLNVSIVFNNIYIITFFALIYHGRE